MIVRPACKSYRKASSSLPERCFRSPQTATPAVALTTAYGKENQDTLEEYATEVRDIETRRTDETRQAHVVAVRASAHRCQERGFVTTNSVGDRALAAVARIPRHTGVGAGHFSAGGDPAG